MDKIMILGALQEFGFRMTNWLLEEGYEVTGIHHQTKDDNAYNERRMMFGRNANYEEMELTLWIDRPLANESSLVLFINGFDEHIQISEIVRNDSLKNKLLECAQQNHTIIIIHPIINTKGERLDTYDFVQEMKKTNGRVMVFHLPENNSLKGKGRQEAMEEENELSQVVEVIWKIVCDH